MITTSAFGLGIDYQQVRAVIVLESAYSILDLLQFFGRAGRDGQNAYCVALALKRRSHADDALNKFFFDETTCRREALWAAVDEFVPTCIQTNVDGFCDNCTKYYEGEQVGSKKRTFSQLASMEIGNFDERRFISQ